MAALRKLLRLRLKLLPRHLLPHLPKHLLKLQPPLLLKLLLLIRLLLPKPLLQLLLAKQNKFLNKGLIKKRDRGNSVSFFVPCFMELRKILA